MTEDESYIGPDAEFSSSELSEQNQPNPETNRAELISRILREFPQVTKVETTGNDSLSIHDGLKQYSADSFVKTHVEDASFLIYGISEKTEVEVIKSVREVLEKNNAELQKRIQSVDRLKEQLAPHDYTEVEDYEAWRLLELDHQHHPNYEIPENKILQTIDVLETARKYRSYLTSAVDAGWHEVAGTDEADEKLHDRIQRIEKMYPGDENNAIKETMIRGMQAQKDTWYDRSLRVEDADTLIRRVQRNTTDTLNGTLLYGKLLQQLQERGITPPAMPWWEHSKPQGDNLSLTDHGFQMKLHGYKKRFYVTTSYGSSPDGMRGGGTETTPVIEWKMVHLQMLPIHEQVRPSIQLVLTAVSDDTYYDSVGVYTEGDPFRKKFKPEKHVEEFRVETLKRALDLPLEDRNNSKAVEMAMARSGVAQSIRMSIEHVDTLLDTGENKVKAEVFHECYKDILQINDYTPNQNYLKAIRWEIDNLETLKKVYTDNNGKDVELLQNIDKTLDKLRTAENEIQGTIDHYHAISDLYATVERCRLDEGTSRTDEEKRAIWEKMISSIGGDAILSEWEKRMEVFAHEKGYHFDMKMRLLSQELWLPLGIDQYRTQGRGRKPDNEISDFSKAQKLMRAIDTELQSLLNEVGMTLEELKTHIQASFYSHQLGKIAAEQLVNPIKPDSNFEQYLYRSRPYDGYIYGGELITSDQKDIPVRWSGHHPRDIALLNVEKAERTTPLAYIMNEHGQVVYAMVATGTDIEKRSIQDNPSSTHDYPPSRRLYLVSHSMMDTVLPKVPNTMVWDGSTPYTNLTVISTNRMIGFEVDSDLFKTAQRKFSLKDQGALQVVDADKQRLNVHTVDLDQLIQQNQKQLQIIPQEDLETIRQQEKAALEEKRKDDEYRSESLRIALEERREKEKVENQRREAEEQKNKERQQQQEASDMILKENVVEKLATAGITATVNQVLTVHVEAMKPMFWGDGLGQEGYIFKAQSFGRLKYIDTISGNNLPIFVFEDQDRNRLYKQDDTSKTLSGAVKRVINNKIHPPGLNEAETEQPNRHTTPEAEEETEVGSRLAKQILKEIIDKKDSTSAAEEDTDAQLATERAKRVAICIHYLNEGMTHEVAKSVKEMLRQRIQQQGTTDGSHEEKERLQGIRDDFNIIHFLSKRSVKGIEQLTPEQIVLAIDHSTAEANRITQAEESVLQNKSKNDSKKELVKQKNTNIQKRINEKGEHYIKGLLRTQIQTYLMRENETDSYNVEEIDTFVNKLYEEANDNAHDNQEQITLPNNDRVEGVILA